ADDWKDEIVVHRGSVGDFIEQHELKPHWIPQLRRFYPDLFPKRSPVPSDPDEVKTLAEAWQKEVVSGDVSTPEFLKQHGLAEKALAALREKDPSQFKRVFSWGSERGPSGPKSGTLERIATLAKQWDR